ncbi:nucleotidyltransferase domain-containing protein [Microbacterium lacus]|uniref:nucleotidyltransferase domain-containing protein n=1 Tax=Microbacterium lacus TaxID=415217 RepID=UPI00384CC4B9
MGSDHGARVRGWLVAGSALVALVGAIVTVVYFFQPWRSCEYEDTSAGCAMLPVDATVMAVAAVVTLAAVGDPGRDSEQSDWRAKSDRSRVALARYPELMGVVTRSSLALREVIDARRGELDALLAKYAARNPRLFGSVARGDADDSSDIDILVEMDPADGNLLMRASGLLEETRELFGRDDIDIFPVQLLKRPISESALVDAVAL